MKIKKATANTLMEVLYFLETIIVGALCMFALGFLIGMSGC